MASPPPDRIEALLWPLDDEVDPWHTSAQAPLVLTYQFATNSQPGDLEWEYSGWTAFSTAQKNAVRAAFAEYQSIINVTFTEVTGAGDPDINLGRVDLDYSGEGGFEYSYSTNGGGEVTEKEIDGYAVFEKSEILTDSDGRSLILHEVGHAMTLKHPGNYDVSGSGQPPPYLPEDEDNNKFSVMSYIANPDNGAFSAHLMLYDIAALQARFGANLSTRTGTDTYTGPDDGLIQVIWDAGGIDTINGSAFSSVTIDLRDGRFSSVGGTHNLAIAYGVVIENATGGAGNDALIGNAAANVLNGGGGADSMNGQAGDDTFYVNNASDVIFEAAGGGVDTVRTSVSYTLGAGVSVYTLQTLLSTSTTVINLTGNESSNRLIGNAAANTIDGKGGVDIMQGMNGNDTYRVDNAGDMIVEAAAANTDTVIIGTNYALTAGADIELLRTSTQTSTSALILTGNERGQTIQGNNGANTIIGKAGTDTLTGNLAGDNFRFDTALGTSNIDTITDYSVSADTVQLQNAIFTALTTQNVTLAEDAFHIGSAAADAEDRIIYNSAAGSLYYDSGGTASGSLVKFATLSGGLALTNADFFVI